MLGTAQQIATCIAVQHWLAEDRVLRVAAVERVADRLHTPVHIHICLHDVALAHLEATCERVANLGDRAANLVPHHDGVRAQITRDFGVRLAQPYDFEVAEAYPDGVDAHQ